MNAPTIEQLQAEKEFLLNRLNRALELAETLLGVCETWEKTSTTWRDQARSTARLWEDAMKTRIPWEQTLIWSGLSFIAGLVAMAFVGTL